MQGIVYGLRDPRDQRIRYVGQTVKKKARRRSHELNHFQGNIEKCNWVRELRSAGVYPEMVDLEICAWSELLEREHYWIQRLVAEGCDLLNRPVGKIRRADLVTHDKWVLLCDTAAAIREDLLELYVELSRCTTNTSREVAAAGKAENAVLKLKHLIEDRVAESSEKRACW